MYFSGDFTGRQFGNYRLIRLLGQGGFASVYLGEHIHLGSKAAIKVLHAHVQENQREQFLAEGRLIASLDHPNIIRVMDFAIERTIPFLVMSYAPDGSLRNRHQYGEQLPLSLIITYVKQIADALDYAHSRNLIHRDVKPENILLGSHQELLLSDFGIAVIQTSLLQRTRETAGTMAYAAPEQMQGKPVPASDQYSLGIMLYEWLTGMRPFQGNYVEVLAQHMSAPVPPLREKRPDVTVAVENVVLRALEKDARRRFPTTRALAQSLEQACSMPSNSYIPTIPAYYPSQKGATTSSNHSQQVLSSPKTGLPAHNGQTNSLTQNSSATPSSAFHMSNSAQQPSAIYSEQRGKSSEERTSHPRLTSVNMPSVSPYTQIPPPPPPLYGQPAYNMPPHASPGSLSAPVIPYPVPVTVPKRKSSTCLIVGIVAVVILGLCGIASSIGNFSLINGETNSNNSSANSPQLTPPAALPVTNATLYNADWSKNSGGWVGSPEWKRLSNGLYVSDGTDSSYLSNGGTPFLALAPYTPSTADYSVEGQIEWLNPPSAGDYSDSPVFGVLARGDTSGNGYLCGGSIDSSGNTILVLERIDENQEGGNTTFLGTYVYPLGQQYHTFRLGVVNDIMTCSVDGHPYLHSVDNVFTQPGMVGLIAVQAEINVHSFQVLK